MKPDDRSWEIMAYRVWLTAYHHGRCTIASKRSINQAFSYPGWSKFPTDRVIEHIKNY